MKVFVIDQARCNGCYGCQIACKDEHCGNDWMPYQRPQPETGHFWLRLHETTHGQVPKVAIEYKPLLCNHCENPPCASMSDSVSVRDDGLVVIDPIAAVGERALVDACPYGAIYWNKELEIPQKCDGCAHLVDAGEVPHCVDLCVPEALRFGDEDEFGDVLNDAVPLPSLDGGRPRVYYLNAPGLFIGGEVWCSTEDECIAGSTVNLTLPDGSLLQTATDDFGDFWFRGLEPGMYKLAIKAANYVGVEGFTILLEKSQNVGNFDLGTVTE
jgi:Fe-S-cluster-containing dehydrogenase component